MGTERSSGHAREGLAEFLSRTYASLMAPRLGDRIKREVQASRGAAARGKREYILTLASKTAAAINMLKFTNLNISTDLAYPRQ